MTPCPRCPEFVEFSAFAMKKNINPGTTSQENLMKRAITSIIIILLATSMGVLGQDAVQVARKAFPSTVLIICKDSNGRQVSLGSGFVIAPGVVATNHHVIDGAASATIKVIGEQQTHNVIHIRNIDARNDLALLTVNGLKAPAVEIGDSSDLEVGSTVYAVGNPQGLEGSFSQGIVSAIRPIGDVSLLQITAPISPGSSGGPVLNASGKVVGVSVATYNGGQNLNFAIPPAALSGLARQPDENATFAVALSKSKGVKTILGEVGANKILEGVTGSAMQWNGLSFGTLGLGDFSVSVRNMINKPISNVIGIMIIYDKQGQPLDFTIINYQEVIPPNLTKRVNGQFDKSVVGLTTSVSPQNNAMYALSPSTKVEFRALYFNIKE